VLHAHAHLVPLALEAVREHSHLLAQRCGRGCLPVRARQHGDLCKVHGQGGHVLDDGIHRGQHLRQMAVGEGQWQLRRAIPAPTAHRDPYLRESSGPRRRTAVVLWRGWVEPHT